MRPVPSSSTDRSEGRRRGAEADLEEIGLVAHFTGETPRLDASGAPRSTSAPGHPALRKHAQRVRRPNRAGQARYW